MLASYLDLGPLRFCTRTSLDVPRLPRPLLRTSPTFPNSIGSSLTSLASLRQKSWHHIGLTTLRLNSRTVLNLHQDTCTRCPLRNSKLSESSSMNTSPSASFARLPPHMVHWFFSSKRRTALYGYVWTSAVSTASRKKIDIRSR
jgi:hypothetical protein